MNHTCLYSLAAGRHCTLAVTRFMSCSGRRLVGPSGWLNLCFLGPTWVHNPNGKSTGQPFLHSSWQKAPILYIGSPFPSKLPLSIGGCGPPSNTWFLGPTQVLNLNCILIASAIFAGLTSVTDWQTDHATQLVTIVHIYIHSTGDVA